MSDLGNVTKAWAILIGLTYALNLTFPKSLGYNFEAFQKLILQLDACKFTSNMLSHKKKLLV